MKSSLQLNGERISIVIPSARSFPLALIQQLESQAVEGDEILMVQNRPRLVEHRWVGISFSGKSSLRNIDPHTCATVTRSKTAALQKGVPVVVLDSDSGAAAARNLGWHRANNDSVLFLDDDIRVGETFLSDLRRYLTRRPIADVVTFRILTKPNTEWSSRMGATIALDRGPRVYRTGERPLRLQDVWRYGAGAAMLVNQSILKVTGGFKNQLGAGRRNGGTEDAEFLWHASRHAMVEYHGCISVLHEAPSSFENLARKMREYGRAIGHLGGMTKSVEGYRYVSGYCSHLDATRRLNDLLRLPMRNLSQARLAVTVAISETLRAYRTSLVRSRQSGILCDDCRGLSS